jgi:CheY-like chemotaxis protein
MKVGYRLKPTSMGVSRGMRPLVLVVDDDEPILDSLGEILAEEGYAVATARNGKEALAYLAANPSPDCILLDVMMPVMNGYDFRRAQLRDSRLAAIPTLLLTAGHVDGRVAELRLSGWLRKPINLPVLLASVQQHCGPPVDSLVAPFAGHVVHFYLQESRMLDRAAAHLAAGLESRGMAVAVCTGQHWDGLQDRLAARQLDPIALVSSGRLHRMDASAVVAQLRARQSQGLDPRLPRQLGGAGTDDIAPVPDGPIRLFGEVGNLLWQAGQFAEARELEDSCNESGQESPMSILCSYDVRQAGNERNISAAGHQHAQITRDLA